jgi:spore coat polysaccharide biosynthesis predicted glycosyltransferase SpsG
MKKVEKNEEWSRASEFFCEISKCNKLSVSAGRLSIFQTSFILSTFVPSVVIVIVDNLQRSDNNDDKRDKEKHTKMVENLVRHYLSETVDVAAERSRESAGRRKSVVQYAASFVDIAE